MTLKHHEVPAAETPGEAEPGARPRGIGSAVAFDWALGAQLLIDGVCFAAGVGPGSALSSWQPGARIVAGVVTGAGAIPCALAGEAMRRGFRPFRRVQMAGNALLLAAGLAGLPVTVAMLRRHGLPAHIGAIVNESVLLFADGAIIWLLARPQTREWFAETSGAEARKRHGRRWMAGILAIAVASGAAVAFEWMY